MMARTVSCGAGPAFAFIQLLSPAAGLALVLFLQPAFQRVEVIENGRGIYLARAGELLERLLPRPAGAELEHGRVFLARRLVVEDRALVQRPLEAGGITQRLVELELQDEREEVARVRGVARDVVLGARIEILLAAFHRRHHTLVLEAQVPPGLVVFLG